MSKSSFGCASLVFILLLTSSAKADILLTLKNGNTVVDSEQFTGNFGGDAFKANGYAVEFQTALTNYPGTSGTGTLSSTVNLVPSSGTNIPDLTVVVQVVNSSGDLELFSSPISASGYAVSNTATLASGAPSSESLMGSAQVNGTNAAPILISLLNSNSGMQTSGTTVPGNSAGYTLSQSYTLSNVQSAAGTLTIGFNTSVSASLAGASLPEPSSFLLTGFVALGLGGVALRRRMWARPMSLVA